MECFYRHPEGEEGSISRKRTLSNQMNSQINKTPKTSENFQNNQEDHFLFQKMMDLEKKYQNLEEIRMEKKEEKRENFPTGWMNTRWSPAPTQVPAFQPQGHHLPSFHPQGNIHVPPFQPQRANPAPTVSAPGNMNGNQWIQHPQEQMLFQVPGVHQYQNQ